MPTDFYMFFIVALIPMLVGYLYYNDALLEKLGENSTVFSKKI